MHLTPFSTLIYASCVLAMAMHASSPTIPTSPVAVAAAAAPEETINYREAHSYGDDYQFKSGDGWESIPITNEPYKYTREPTANANATATRDESDVLSGPTGVRVKSRHASSSVKKMKMRRGKNDKSAVISGIVHIVDETWNSLKGIGKAQDVFITW